ncbi:MAG: hypothetical protein ACRDPD_00805 [Streptosporangiaceae bacterium]
MNESASVTLDGSGNGILKMVPYGGGLAWLPSVVSVKASSDAAEASCRIYIGPAATDQWFVDGTLSGSTGDSTDAVSGRQVDTHGSTLWAVWESGDAGAEATMTVSGTETRP